MEREPAIKGPDLDDALKDLDAISDVVTLLQLQLQLQLQSLNLADSEAILMQP